MEENEEMQQNCTAHHGTLFHWVIEKQNRVGWHIKVIGLATDEAMQFSCIGKRETYYEKLNDLVKWGLITLIQKSTNAYTATKVSLHTDKFLEFTRTENGTGTETGNGTSGVQLGDFTCTENGASNGQAGGQVTDRQGTGNGQVTDKQRSGKGTSNGQAGSTLNKLYKLNKPLNDLNLVNDETNSSDADASPFQEAETVDGKVIPFIPKKPKSKRKAPHTEGAGTGESKEKTTHQLFLDVYIKWYKDQFEMSPPLTIADHAGLKHMITYLKSQATNKEEQGPLQAFEFILDKWDKVEPFYQKQTKLSQINSNLANIIASFKNGNKKTGNGAVSRSEQNKADLAAYNAELDNQLRNVGGF